MPLHAVIGYRALSVDFSETAPMERAVWADPRRDLPLVDANRAKRPKADIPLALTNVCFRG
jgi:hypothetical protein